MLPFPEISNAQKPPRDAITIRTTAQLRYPVNATLGC